MAITIPNTFSANTTIASAEVNENFTALSTGAVDKTGDTLTGTLNTQTLLPVTDATYDLGSASKQYGDLYLSGSIIGPAGVNAFGTITVSGQTDVVADTTADTLTLVAGAGITITTTPASDTVTLTADGEVEAGSSGVNAKQGGVLYQDITTTGNVGTGEDVLYTATIAANVLATNGDTLHIHAFGTKAANANAKTMKFYFGSTSLTIVNAEQQSANTSWRLDAYVTRTGPTSQAIVAAISSGGGLRYKVTTASETLSGSIITKLTGEATADNDIVRYIGTVEWLPSAV